jgi:ribosomal protein S18 acetylase RimI-like enzyme
MANSSAYCIAPVATQADLAAIRTLFVAYATSLTVDLSFQQFDTELATLPGAYAPPLGALLLARDPQGKAAGCIALRPLGEAGIGEIKRLYVAPEARGRQLGEQLARAMLHEAAARGYRELRLDTLPGMGAAIALYHKLGFTPTAPYYATPIDGTLFFARTLG